VKIHYLLALLLIPFAASAQQPDRSYFSSPTAQQRHLPFSGAVLVGDTLYISGTLGSDPNAKQPITAEAESRRVMDSVKQIVEQAGLTMDDLVSVQVFCIDLKDYDAFNRVYATYFHGNYPARSFIGASGLLFGARYEVMGVAVRRHK
jgi:2-iminobutanoate/2-iminopropanoate deaminase